MLFVSPNMVNVCVHLVCLWFVCWPNPALSQLPPVSCVHEIVSCLSHKQFYCLTRSSVIKRETVSCNQRVCDGIRSLRRGRSSWLIGQLNGVILPLAKAPASWNMVHSFSVQPQSAQTRLLQSPGCPSPSALSNWGQCPLSSAHSFTNTESILSAIGL